MPKYLRSGAGTLRDKEIPRRIENHTSEGSRAVRHDRRNRDDSFRLFVQELPPAGWTLRTKTRRIHLWITACALDADALVHSAFVDRLGFCNPVAAVLAVDVTPLPLLG